TAAVTCDFKSGKKLSYLMTKLVTVFVTLVALIIALYGNESVFSLVLISWSVLAASFAPLLIIYALGGKPSEKLAIVISVSGVLTIVAWKIFKLDGYIYEVAPGILMGLLVFLLSKLFIKSNANCQVS
ncbi:MAG: sodium/proline symporter, partial [Ulvibacter sp.]